MKRELSAPSTTYEVDLLIIKENREVPFHEQIKSVNYHITRRCNYACRFCYAHFYQVESRLTKNESLELISHLAAAGTEKITFVGGEPTLVSYLPDLVIHAKSLGMTTMIVTNGTKITAKYLQQFQGSLDWVGISIDSGKEEICKQLGRGRGNHVAMTLAAVELLREFNIRIKINTVVTALNWSEDMNWLIKKLVPERWKVFQMLPIEDENDDAWDLLIGDKQFQYFLNTHREQNPVAEFNDNMIDSYVMIDPEGCFFNNSNSSLSHGISILEHGVENAFRFSNFSLDKFIQRKGNYNWSDQE